MCVLLSQMLPWVCGCSAFLASDGYGQRPPVLWDFEVEKGTFHFSRKPVLAHFFVLRLSGVGKFL